MNSYQGIQHVSSTSNDSRHIIHMPPVMIIEVVEGMQNDVTGMANDVSAMAQRPTIHTDDIREIKFQIDYGAQETGCFFDSSQIRATFNTNNFLAHPSTSCIITHRKSAHIQKVDMIQYNNIH